MSPGPAAVGGAKRQACAAVDAMAGELVAVSHRIHAHPELGYREEHAARLLAQAMRDRRLAVQVGPYGLPTAVAGRVGAAGDPHVIVSCEYDAVPGLGHACGHNVIAAAGLGAGLALAPLAGPLGGRLTVLGTPAEEGGGGKILLGEQGAFDGATAAMQVHPSSYEAVLPPVNAAATLEAIMHGRAAHASMYPERGVNALDALVLGYLGLSALRQHLVPTDKVHGIITAGGSAPSVVPELAAGTFMVRSATLPELERLKGRVLACLQGGAGAAGARLTARWRWPTYLDLRPNRPLAGAFEANLRALGRRPLAPAEVPATRASSTDMGNVSHLVPAVQPMLAISPPDVVPHTPAFAAWAVRPPADRAVLDGAKALAMTAIDLWLRPGLAEAVRLSHAGRPAAARPAGRPPAAAAAPGR
jgi:amidohydrolase